MFSINLTPINTHSVNFNVLGHGTNPHSYDFVGHNKTIAPPKNPEDLGWTFLAWYKEQTFTNLWDFETDVVDEDKMLYAKWQANSYTVIYNTNGHGTVSPATTQVFFDSPYGTMATPSCDGYTFNGWYYDSDCSEGNLVTSATLVKVASDHELYAKWTPNTYNVTFNKNGHGSDPAPPSKDVTFDDVYGELPTLEEEGYTFSGWYLDEECTQSKFVGPETIVKTVGKHSLYAKWTANQYFVTFDKQGHGQDSGDISVTFDSQYGTLPILSESGFTFGGWYLDSSCSQDKEVISTTIVKISENHKLYAKWSGNKYTVNFNKNGHGVDPVPSSKDVFFDSVYGELPEMSANGYNFNGWYLDSSCSEGKEVDSDTIVTTASDHSIYAKWEIIHYNITWNTDGGSSVTGGSTSYTIEDTSINIPSVPPTKTNWHFSGWLASGATNWPDYEFKESPVLANAFGNVTLKAQWGQLFYGISESSNGKSLYLSGVQTEKSTTTNNEALVASEDSSCGWSDVRSEINSVIIENDIKPDSTAFWFYNFTSCSSINLEKLKTFNVTNINHMFDGCSQLASLDVSSLGTSKVTSMECLFNGCSLLKSLDLENFDTSRTVNMTNMFSSCPSLETIYVSDSFNTSNVNPGTIMFNDDTNLKAWLGTKYNINHTDVTYAIVDGNLDKPGYFSRKCNLFYQVTIWGIGQDKFGPGDDEKVSLSFGPANGKNKSCLEVDGHSSHGSGKHCIHEDSWIEIIKNCKDGHADWYSDCIKSGCTKSVPIILNSTLGSMPTEKVICSTLLEDKHGGKIKEDYRKWNLGSKGDGDCESANWATSRIRSTLNGYDNALDPFTPSEFAGDNNLTSSNCILSCFPSLIANAITPKYYQVPIFWEYSYDKPISDSVYVSDKLWLPSAEEVFGLKDADAWIKEYSKEQYTKKKQKNVTYKDNRHYNCVFYDNGDSVSWWLRSPYRSSSWFIGGLYELHDIDHGGWWIYISLDSKDYGISPCFCF